MSVDNKVVLVTGASRGIGQAITQCFLQQGYCVIGTSTSKAGADHITKKIAEHSGKGTGLVLDVTQPDSIEACFSQIKSQFGMPTILINNAAITKDNLLMRMNEADWQQVIDTNLSSVYRITKKCLRDMMKARWGRVISIGSVVGSIGNFGQANYAAAKAGLTGFSKALALEVASRNITVNVVAPGFVDTDMTRELTEEQQAALAEKIPAGRVAAASEVAHLVAFLASEQAGYITGQTIHVNGGLHLT